MKAVIYARVSKGEEHQNPERQLLKCRQYCELNDHEIIGEFTEGITGETNPFERPELKKALELKPDLFIVISLDRFTREDLPQVFRRLEHINKLGIGFVSVTEPMFSADNEFKTIFIALIAWFNNYYLRELSRKVKQGQERARAEGKHIGRPKIPQNMVYEILRLRNKGDSLKSISEAVSLSKTTVHKVCDENKDLLYKEIRKNEGVHKAGVK